MQRDPGGMGFIEVNGEGFGASTIASQSFWTDRGQPEVGPKRRCERSLFDLALLMGF